MADTSIDMPFLLSRQSVKADGQVGTGTPCIALPDHLRNEKPRAYEPQVVSLGPCHLGKPLLDKCERFKSTLPSPRLPNRDQHFKVLVDRIIQHESKIRQWYAPYGNKYVASSELACMIAQDGLFLLQVLRHIASAGASRASTRFASARFASVNVGSARFSHISREISRGPDGNASRFFLPMLQPSAVQEDIMKIENQIPLFALKMISEWEIETLNTEWEARVVQNPISRWDWLTSLDLDAEAYEATYGEFNSILRLAWHTLSPFCFDSQEFQVFAGAPVKLESHLLGFVYANIIRPWDRSTDNVEHKLHHFKRSRLKTDITLPRAVELQRRGVNFSSNKGPLNDIRFDRGNCTIHLPTVELDERTDAVMRNLLAFEMFVYEGKEKPLKCYVDMMDRLINRAEDVELLRNDGIIHSNFGTDEEVATVWNGMGKHLHNSKYEPIEVATENVITFYTSKYRIMWAEFKKKYLSRPWLVVALIAGLFSLTLSVLQTILSWEQVRLQIESMK